ncbi:MAG: hypothetical protein B6U76_00510 [Desulfurococcales archaeon ex4484_217_2]|nr:MAG: hypothetical protein B6U76_00510 [Desulfurococcales archaeon ex4484_217_2]
MVADMGSIVWFLNVLIAFLAAINAICWGYAIREVGDPSFNLEFLFTLIFNKWFIAAMLSAFTASLLSYTIMRQMGVLVGRFFISLSIVSTILACTLVLGEKLTVKEWVGIALIIIGVLILGRQ